MTERSTSPPPAGPSSIRRLQESLINRIAAGEIIHRPASALKELIENCLDAGSTSIRVTVKDGGLKLLQLQDNGCGIRKSDLPILAERFTTSKLSTFSDLSRLTTYGFRGEALASISHVANLTVVTKTKEDPCAWKVCKPLYLGKRHMRQATVCNERSEALIHDYSKEILKRMVPDAPPYRACYEDGSLVPTKPGLTSEPKACAGNDGTTITVENLFYNTPTRLSALRSSSEEYARILDVVTRYAVHNPHVSFVCRKAGSPSPDVSTPSASTTPQAIRLLYGHGLAKELVHVPVSSRSKRKAASRVEDEDEDAEMEEIQEDDQGVALEKGDWKAEAYVTNANYHAKKMVFLLFINHRLVESSRIRRTLELVYNGILPKGAAPFVYLSLEIDPSSVDVNVHPTKREVHFLNEDSIVQSIADDILDQLVGQNSRVFEYQTLLTGGIQGPDDGEKASKGKAKVREKDDQSDDIEMQDVESEGSSLQPLTPAPEPTKKTVYSHHKVRTSTQNRTLDSMFPVANPSQVRTPEPRTTKRSDASKGKEKELGSDSPAPFRLKEIKESECYLTSVKTLRENIQKGKHKHLTEIIEKHTFVGIVDLHRCLSLVQHSTRLYLVNHGALAEELFYQLGLRQFGNLTKIKLDPPPDLRSLIRVAVEAEDGTSESKFSKSQIVDMIAEKLISRKDMLSEYFSLNVSADGLLLSLPLLLRGYTPNLDKLPLFLMRLGPQVDWTSERECFEGFLRELAYFYTPGPIVLPEPRETEVPPQDSPEEKAERWQIEHVMFPTMRKYLYAPKSLLDRDVVQVANLPDLYRIFERC